MIGNANPRCATCLWRRDTTYTSYSLGDWYSCAFSPIVVSEWGYCHFWEKDKPQLRLAFTAKRLGINDV